MLCTGVDPRVETDTTFINKSSQEQVLACFFPSKNKMYQNTDICLFEEDFKRVAEHPKFSRRALLEFNDIVQVWLGHASLCTNCLYT